MRIKRDSIGNSTLDALINAERGRHRAVAALTFSDTPWFNDILKASILRRLRSTAGFSVRTTEDSIHAWAQPDGAEAVVVFPRREQETPVMVPAWVPSTPEPAQPEATLFGLSRGKLVADGGFISLGSAGELGASMDLLREATDAVVAAVGTIVSGASSGCVEGVGGVPVGSSVVALGVYSGIVGGAALGGLDASGGPVGGASAARLVVYAGIISASSLAQLAAVSSFLRAVAAGQLGIADVLVYQAAAGDNIFPNPGFEEHALANDWVVVTPTCARTTEDAHTGSYSAKMQSGFGSAKMYIELPTSIGATYTLSFWFKHALLAQYSDLHVGSNSPNYLDLIDTTFGAVSGWSQYSGTFTATASTTRITIGHNSFAEVSYLDDFSLTEV